MSDINASVESWFAANVVASRQHIEKRRKELSHDQLTDNADLCAALYLIDEIDRLKKVVNSPTKLRGKEA